MMRIGNLLTPMSRWVFTLSLLFGDWGVSEVAAQPAPAEPPRREVSGTVLSLDTFGATIQTPTGLVRIQVGAGRADQFGFAQGLGELVPGLGPFGAIPGFPPGRPDPRDQQQVPGEMPAPPPAPLPVEFQVRVTATTDVIQVDDRLVFLAKVDPRTRIPVEPLESVERIPAGEPDPALPALAADEDDEEEDEGPTWQMVRVVRRRGNEVTVESGARTIRLPLSRDAIVRFNTADPRWVGLGDQLEATGRQNRDGSLQATRIRVAHLDASLVARELPVDEFAAALRGDREDRDREDREGDEAMGLAGGAMPAGGEPGAARPAGGLMPIAGAPMTPPAAAAGDEAEGAEEPEVNPVAMPAGGGRAFGRRVKIN